MKKFLSCAVFLITVAVMAKDLKVLMIGNSFSICVGKNLPHMVAHEKKHNLELTSAFIGGCRLDQHIANIRKAEKNPSFKPYWVDTWSSKNLRKKHSRYGNVNELLKNNKYDIITIQQGSVASWDHKLYQPHANELIAYIKKHNPQAEIVIQQTWAYRADSPRLKKWKFSQQEMSDRVIAAYDKLAQEAKLRIIPTGKAIEIARRHPNYKYRMPSAEEVAKFVSSDCPSRSHDVVGRHYWRKDKKGLRMIADTIHLNEHGEYLQACVWYSFLFSEDAEKITYEPLLAPESCKILRNAASSAIKKYKK